MKKKITAWLMIAAIITGMLMSATVTVFADDDDMPLPAADRIFYVDAESGDDSFDGRTAATAWKTLDNVNNTEFLPSDAILLKRGCTWSNTFLWPKGSGSAEKPITLGCYGDKNAELPYVSSYYGDDMTGLPNADTCLNLESGQNYWIVENLYLTNGTPSTGGQSVVRIYGSSSKRTVGNILRDCTIYGSNPDNWSTTSKSGLTAVNVGGFIDSVLIENNTVLNAKSKGISVNGSHGGMKNHLGEINDTTSGKGVVIRGNFLSNIGTDGILVNNCYKPLVEYNTVARSHSYATNSAHVAMWPFACYGALFQYNEAYDTKTIYDGQGFDCDYMCYDTTFQYNYSHDNTGGFMLICTEASASWVAGGYTFNVGSRVRYNISQNDNHYVFSVIGGVQDTMIYNNTIYSKWRNSNSTHLFFVYDKGANKLTGLRYADDIQVLNNIFYLDAMGGNQLNNATGLKWKNNIVYGNHGNVGFPNDDKAPVDDGVDSSGNMYATNPKLVNAGSGGKGIDSCDGYMLYDNSPAIGAGIPVTEHGLYACENDYFGNAVTGAPPNIGAYNGAGVYYDTAANTFDGKYEPLIDFEQFDTAPTGTMIRQCESVSNNTSVVVTEDAAAQNPATAGKRALSITNEADGTASCHAKFRVYQSDLKDANGIRFYADGNGADTTGTIQMAVGSQVYSKSFKVSKDGGYITFTFNEKYTGSSDARVTPQIMRGMKTIAFYFTVASKATVYLDDIQVNNGEMDAETVVKTPDLEPANTELIQDFDSFGNVSTHGSNAYGAPWSGPNGDGGIRPFGSGKAMFSYSVSSASTGVNYGFIHNDTFAALRSKLAQNSEISGVQFNFVTTVFFDLNGTSALTENEQYIIRDRTNLYKFSFASSRELSLDDSGTAVSTKSLSIENVRADSNGLVRIAFDKLYYSADGKKYMLSDFSEQQQRDWLEGIINMGVSYTTYGGRLGKTLYITWYLDNFSVYTTINHAQGEWVTEIEADCTHDGLLCMRCPVCSEVLETKVAGATGHDMGDWETVTEKTCTTDGEKVKLCKNCHEQMDKQTEKSEGHKYDTELVPAACLTAGYTVYSCSVCAETHEDAFTEPTGHHATDWIIDVAPSCTADGNMHKECADCQTLMENAAAVKTGHTYKATITPAGCVTGGITEYKCVACDDVFTRDITAAHGHIFSQTWTVDKAPNVKEKGSKSHHCTVCDAKTDITALPKLSAPLGKVKLKTIRLNKAKKAVVVYGKVAGADGYQIMRKVGGGKFKAIKTTAATRFVDKRFTAGKRYYYKVRAYTVLSGKKQFGAFSRTGRKFVKR